MRIKNRRDYLKFFSSLLGSARLCDNIEKTWNVYDITWNA